MLKQQRNYKIVFEILKLKNGVFELEKTVTVAYPFTINFDVEVETYAQSPEANIQLFNLNETTRNTLWKEPQVTDKKIEVKLYAGYGQTMPLIFSGTVIWCYSYKDGGSVDFVTHMEVKNWAAYGSYGYLSYTFKKGTSAQDVIDVLCNHEGLFSQGYISPDIPPLKSSQTFSGNVVELLRQEFIGYKVYVDKNELYVLKDNEIVPAGHIQVITSETGLLGTPQRAAGGYLRAEMIFEPEIIINQGIRIKSNVMPFLNNDYQVIGIKHSGMISPSQSGQLTTTLTLSLVSGKTTTIQKKTEVKGQQTSGDKASGKFIKPVKGTITSNFGNRVAPVKGASTFHKGIDIGANTGTPIKATYNGKVKFVGWINGYGKTVMINHGIINGKEVISQYSHMNNWAVESGQSVSKEQTIGYVGATGVSSGPHLHFAIMENGKYVNPTQYIGR